MTASTISDGAGMSARGPRSWATAVPSNTANRKPRAPASPAGSPAPGIPATTWSNWDRADAMNSAFMASTDARRSGSVRAATHSSTHAMNAGPAYIDHRTSMAASSRSTPGSSPAMAFAVLVAAEGEQVVDGGAHQLGLAGEVVLQRPDRHAGLAGHGAGGGAGVAVPHDALDGGVEQRLAGRRSAVGLATAGRAPPGAGLGHRPHCDGLTIYMQCIL